MRNFTRLYFSIRMTTLIFTAMKMLFLFAAALFTASATCGEGIETLSAPEEQSYSTVVIKELPSTLDFAGEKVPLEYFDIRESLRREMLVTLYMHSRTYLTLLNTQRYFAIIEPVLERNGIPEDFKYLCMAESGLDPEAVSSAGAGGLWQIMPATGRGYGLVAGDGIDQRFDIEKSTEAACKHLLESYNKFGSWTLAAAAYNLGNAGVAKRLERQGQNNYYDAFFPAETMRYLFRVLSFKLITPDPSQYGYVIARGDYYEPLTDYSEVEVGGTPIDWPKVAADNGTNYKMLRLLNPWIRDYEYANKSGTTFTVRIPGPGFRSAER